MPRGLAGRVAARGFPSSVAAGATGAGALESQGGPQDPAHAVQRWGTPTSTLPQFPSEGTQPLQVEILEGTWGLPGTLTDPDETPRTHAAPVPGWAGSYDDAAALAVLRENSTAIHGQDFGALAGHIDAPPDGGVHLPMNPWSANDPGESAQVPLTGPQRALGGSDAIQGYDRRNGYGFDAGHRHRPGITGNVVNAYLDPAERPFIVPQASGSFIPTDAVQGPEPYAGQFDAPSVNPDPPTDYSPPPVPATLPAPLAAAPVTSGWW